MDTPSDGSASLAPGHTWATPDSLPPRDGGDAVARSLPPPGLRTWALLLAGGVAVNAAVDRQPASVSWTLVFGFAIAALISSGWLRSDRTRGTKALLGLAGLFAFGAWVRDSDVLVALNLSAALALVVVATGTGPLDRLLNYRGRAFGSALLALLEEWVPLSFDWSDQFPDPGEQKWRQFGIGLTIAAPLLLVVTLLLVSADAQFEALWTSFSIADYLDDMVVALLGVVGLLAFITRMLRHRREVTGPPLGLLSPTTAAVVLSSLAAMFGLFLLVQVVPGGGEPVLALDVRADSRAGYFQMLTVAAITLVTSWASFMPASATGRGVRLVRRVHLVVVAETLLITLAAGRRVVRLIEVDELTMLRLGCLVAVGLLCGYFVLVGLRAWGWRPDTTWIGGAMAILTLVVIAGLNVANPEAIVARHNLYNIDRVNTIDFDYLARLSGDANGVLIDRIVTLPEWEQIRLLEAMCAHPYETDSDWLEFNWSRSGARNARTSLCAATSDR